MIKQISFTKSKDPQLAFKAKINLDNTEITIITTAIL
jgi:hypothetical protein